MERENNSINTFPKLLMYCPYFTSQGVMSYCSMVVFVTLSILVINFKSAFFEFIIDELNSPILIQRLFLLSYLTTRPEVRGVGAVVVGIICSMIN